MAKRDYYEILGVSKDAPQDEIKRAYRKLAVQHHPDKAGGDEQKFKEATEAYEVLKDEKKRAAYDRFGHAGMDGFAAGGGGARGGHNPFGAGFGGGQVEFDIDDLDLGDIFGSFFGGGRQGRRQQARRGRDVEARVTIDFKEAVFGTAQTIDLDLEDTCSRCKGSMSEPDTQTKTCETCGGQGQVVQTQRTVLGSIQHATVCPVCHGSGQVPEKPCSECHGKGTKRRKHSIEVRLPSGIENGATVRLKERGEAIAGGPKGDLYIHVRVRPSKQFERHGHDILSKSSIDMIDAALGTDIEVETVDGPKKMKIPAGTQSGQTFRLSGRGVPYGRGDKRGDHLVEITVEIPRKLSAKQKELLKQLREGRKKKWL